MKAFGIAGLNNAFIKPLYMQIFSKGKSLRKGAAYCAGILLTLTSFYQYASISSRALTNIKEEIAEEEIVEQKLEDVKVIALAPHIVEMLFSIGAGDNIIGTSEFSDYPSEAKNIPRIGNYMHISLEKVIALQPDIIIAWKSGSPSGDLDKLSKLGFNIVYSNPKNFADISKELRYLGTLTGRISTANKLADAFDLQINHIKDLYSNKKPLVGFYELWGNPLTTVSKGSWPQQYFDICKARNPFENVNVSYPQISIETLLNKNIQFIIQPLSVNQPDKTGFNWQRWSVLPAVKNNHILHPDADSLHRMSLRSIHALDALCKEIDKVRGTLNSRGDIH